MLKWKLGDGAISRQPVPFVLVTVAAILFCSTGMAQMPPGVWQDFSATFPGEGVPGEVTVIMVDHLGNTVVPIVSEPVNGLGPYVGRPGFDARTGGAFADQDVRNFTATYTDGANNFADVFSNVSPAWEEVHNQSWTPQQVPDDWIRVAADNVGSQANNVAWPSVYAGPWDSLTMNFDIRISEGNPLTNDKADGFGFKWINADAHGNSGAFYTAGEEPNLAGSLGVGFDIWNNGAADNSATTSVSLHHDGQLIKTVNLMDPANEPTIDVEFPLETGEPINVTVLVNPGTQNLGPELKGGTGFSVSNRAGNPSHLVDQGNMDAYLRLVDEAGGQLNIVAFDWDGEPAWPELHAHFNFRGFSEEPSRADGMSFLLVPTSTYGETGADQIPSFGAPGGVEEPNLAGAFGVGFDSFNNDAAPQDDPEGMASIGNHVSIHWDENKVAQTNLSLDDFDIVTTDPDVWHTAEVWLKHVDDGTLATVVLTDGADGSVHVVFDDVIPDMWIDEFRPVFAARTGGAFDNYDIDNVHIEHVPEPSSLVMLCSAIGLLAFRRRKKV